MIELDLSILNQKGTPMFYSDNLAARPAFGIAGRIFIAIDSPYGIFRDTGSAWDQIASAGSGVTGSGTLNTIAMFTPSGTAIGDSAITQSALSVIVAARNLIVTNGAFSLSHTHNFVNGTFNPYGEQIAVTNTFNAGITWTALLACFNSSSLQTNLFNGSVTFGNGSYTTNNLNLSNITFNAAGSTITSTQASGGIRAYANQILQLRIDGTNNGTYTHYANSVIYGDFASSTARFTFTNRYGYLVNNLDEYSAGHTYTNRWAFYNAGINDNNFFAGKVGIGSGYVPSGLQLDVNGSVQFRTQLLIGNSLFSSRFTSNGQLMVEENYLDGATDNTGATGAFLIRSAGNIANLSAGGKYYQNLYLKSSITTSYNPAEINEAVIGTVINGTSTGVMRGLLINPTITSGGTGWLAIQSTIGGAYFNTVSVAASAILQADSTTKGFLPPRMTSAQKTAITAVAGLIVFDTTLIKLCVYNGATWETVTSI